MVYPDLPQGLYLTQSGTWSLRIEPALATGWCCKCRIARYSKRLILYFSVFEEGVFVQCIAWVWRVLWLNETCLHAVLFHDWIWPAIRQSSLGVRSKFHALHVPVKKGAYGCRWPSSGYNKTIHCTPSRIRPVCYTKAFVSKHLQNFWYQGSDLKGTGHQPIQLTVPLKIRLPRNAVRVLHVCGNITKCWTDRAR